MLCSRSRQFWKEWNKKVFLPFKCNNFPPRTAPQTTKCKLMTTHYDALLHPNKSNFCLRLMRWTLFLFMTNCFEALKWMIEPLLTACLNEKKNPSNPNNEMWCVSISHCKQPIFFKPNYARTWNLSHISIYVARWPLQTSFSSSFQLTTGREGFISWER